METDDATKRIAEALLSGEEEKLQKLIERLGIGSKLEEFRKQLAFNSDYLELVTWALVGITLSHEQPEFNRRPRGRGRPRKLGVNIDEDRALFIEEAHAYAKQLGGRIISTKKWIVALAGKHPLFPHIDDIQSLQNSVSRGNRRLKSLRADISSWQRCIADRAAGKSKSESQK